MSLLFWESWFKEYRIVWYLLAVMFLFSIGFMWQGYFAGPSNVIDWESLQEQKVLESTVHSFRLGPFVLNVPGESYVILEYLQGSQVEPNATASYIFLAIVFLSLVVLLAVISTLDKIWFYLAIALFSVFLFMLRLEVLGIFGVYHKLVGIAAIAFYLIPLFYFNQIKPSTPVLIRLVIILAITVVLGMIIGSFSREPYPFYHLVVTSFTGTLILSFIFLILVAHEIFATFVFLTSQGKSKSIQHLAILSTIYFANLLITLMYELQLISFDFIYLNVFLLLTISAFLGVWGFRSREVVYGNIFSFQPYGGFLFLALGSLCFATIGHFTANANDPGVHVFRHAILFTQAAYGVIFLLYVLSNFGQMLADNAPVFKVLYLPTRMPYFTFRLAGFIATVAIFIYAGWRSYVYHSFSAFYNVAGDFYTLLDDDKYAYSFYLKAASHGAQNHKSNYRLGMSSAASYDFEQAHGYMRSANARRPSAFSLVNEGNLFIRENKPKEAIAAFRKNLVRDGEQPAIENNLGVSYLKLHDVDSALYFFSLAREKKLSRNAAETNFFGMAALEVIPINIDSVYKIFSNSSPGLLSNLYALSGVLNTPVNLKSDPLQNTQLDLYTATYLNNYLQRYAKQVDTTFTSRAMKVASDPQNANFSEALKASLAFAYYHQGNISKALEILAEQAYLSQTYQGKFNYIMGLWALEQDNPELAATYFNYADTYDYKEAPFYHAIALTESGDLDAALSAWDSVMIRGDEGQKSIASNVKHILSLPISAVNQLDDAAKYQFCRYRFSTYDSTTFNRVAATFENPNYQAQALLDYSKKFFEAGEIVAAIRYYQRITGLKLTNQDLYDDIRHFELRLLASRRELRGLATQINKGIEFDKSRDLDKIYYAALLNEQNGDTLNARKNYSILARYNPYFEEGIISAFEFFRRNSGGFEAYNILAEAIQINSSSVPLLKAYASEAARLGLDDYAQNAYQRIGELEGRRRLWNR